MSPNQAQKRRRAFEVFALVLLVCLCTDVSAHHVLGRPSYSLSEDSNTPPAMQVETQIGEYFVTYMVYPAFPQPGAAGRINLYATRIRDGVPYDGEIAFKVLDDRWFAGPAEHLGDQRIDDAVYRQGFIFNAPGRYIIRAQFSDQGEPYSIDFPLQIGNPPRLGALTLAVTSVVVILFVTTLTQRKRILRARIRAARVASP